MRQVRPRSPNWLPLADYQAANGAIPRPEVNPWAGYIGWCHSCETVQMGDEARWQPMAWNHQRPDWACVTCDDEPWDWGVWPLHLGYDCASRLLTPAARAWLASDAGTAWVILTECPHCGLRHFNEADCSNPPPPGWEPPPRRQRRPKR